MKKTGVHTQKADIKKSNKKHLSLSIMVCSFAVAFVAGRFMCSISANLPGEVIFWNAFFFLLVFIGGYLGMVLGVKLSRKYQIMRPEFRASRFVVVAVLIFLVAGGGQMLFLIEEQTEEIPTVTTITNKEADVVVLLDGSGSMKSSSYVETCVKAATEFVESLDENIRLQVVAFAEKVYESQIGLLTLDEDGKTEVIEYIEKYIESIGVFDYGTNFDDALEAAMDILSESDDRIQIVIMVTDGEAGISDDTKKEFLNSGCKLLSIRTTDDDENKLGQALASYAKSTGGMDAVVELDKDGNMDLSELTAAFKEAISLVQEETSTETITKLGLGNDSLLGTDGTTPYQFLIRLITIFVCAVLFEIGYFGQFSFSKLLRNLILAVVLSVLITIFSVSEAGAMLVVLCMGTSYVTLQVQDASP